MNKNSLARIIIAGTNSGCGKTTITCALISALSQKYKISSFKCGPDYIDPMFHGKILGVNSSNLDPYFYDDNTLKYLFNENAKDSELSIIEGVMGFFDGNSIKSTDCSTYDVAKKLSSPVILTVNCKGSAYSILPIIEGFYKHKSDYNLAGVILNNITKYTYLEVKELIETHFSNKIKVFGYLPKLPEDLVMESRHLGLVTADEIKNIKEKLQKLGEIASETINMDEIVNSASLAPQLSIDHINIKNNNFKVKIAVAKDNAFCFYYKDNLRLLEKLGAKLVYFSPISDEKLPEDIDGLYMGGGYPELYLKELSENNSMKNSILNALKNNIPCIAECGAFMYLNQKISGYDMVSYFNGQSENKKRLTRFGYVELTAKTDNLLCKKGEKFKAHEFHYYDCSNNGDGFLATKNSGKTWEAAFITENLYAGYPHISFWSNINIAENFINKCQEIKNEKR